MSSRAGTARQTAEPSALPRLLSVEAVSRRLSIKPATLRAWARRGEIPAFKLGTLTYFDEADLVAWLAGKREAR